MHKTYKKKRLKGKKVKCYGGSLFSDSFENCGRKGERMQKWCELVKIASCYLYRFA